jgi:Geminivirus Rep catalytic domain
MDIQPRLFQAGSIIDPATFARIEASVCNKLNTVLKQQEEEDDDDKEDEEDEIISDDEQDINEILHNARDEEIRQLSQFIITEQPISDETAQFFIRQLDLALDKTKTITTTNMDVNDINNDQQILTSCLSSSSSSSSIIPTISKNLYPPINQTGRVEDHDRPYAEYGHLDRQTIAQECQFNLHPPSAANEQPLDRLNAKSFAITSWTNVSKELVMNKIKEEFGIVNIQYICISEEISELNHQRHLHIQIIFKEKIDRRKPFLDKITQTHCNYQVTKDDLAWNEYIKKGGNYIEFNKFKSPNKHKVKQWPPQSSSSSSPSSIVSVAAAAALPVSTTTFDDHHNQPLIRRATTTTTVRAQSEERRQHQIQIYKQAVKLAETSIDNAMDLIQREMLDKFVERGTWYETIN